MESPVNEHVTMTGNFRGHMGSGVACAVLGILWMNNSLFRYHVAKREVILSGRDGKNLKYKNRLFSKYHTGWTQRVPLEACVVVFTTISSWAGEIVSYFAGYAGTATAHHMLMNFFYFLLGLTVILKHRKFAFPPGSEYAMFAVANAMQGFTLSQHLAGKSSMSLQMHIILTYLNTLTVLCTVLEVIHTRSVTAALGRTLTFTTQGLWICATGSIIYPLPFMPHWNQEDQGQMDIVTSLGLAIIAIVLTVTLTLNFILSKRVKNINLETINRILALTYEQNFFAANKCDLEIAAMSNSDCEN